MMQFRTVCLSAHLDSFCRRLNELFRGAFEFCYADADPGEMRRQVGWKTNAEYRIEPINEANSKRAMECEVLYDMLREFDLFEARLSKGLKTVYASERWLKPVPLFDFRLFSCLILVRLPGVVRLLVPGYRRMAKRFVKLMDDQNFYVFPIGVPAVRDMVRIYRVLHGDWKAFFCEPKVEIVRKLGGMVTGFPRMRLWAYFVESSRFGNRTEDGGSMGVKGGSRKAKALRILWVGRMLDWKRVDVLIKAFKIVAGKRPAALLLVGDGPERKWLENLAGESKGSESQKRGVGGLEWVEGKVLFHDYVKSDEVRRLMRATDVYVMPSNAEEGWGAAISDALSESCRVISTYEAGSSATLLSDECLCRAGSVKDLSRRLLASPEKMIKYDVESWGGSSAARKLLEIIKCEPLKN